MAAADSATITAPTTRKVRRSLIRVHTNVAVRSAPCGSEPGRHHGEACGRPLHRHLVGLSRRCADAATIASISSRSGTTSSTHGLRRTRTRSTTCAAPRRTATGLGASPAGARGRRRRRRGALPEHGPAVLSDRSPRHPSAHDPRRLRPSVRRDPGAQSLARRLLRRDARAPAGIAQIFLYDIDDAVEEVNGRGTRICSVESCSPASRLTPACRRSTHPTTSRSGTCVKTLACRSTIMRPGGA